MTTTREKRMELDQSLNAVCHNIPRNKLTPPSVPEREY